MSDTYTLDGKVRYHPWNYTYSRETKVATLSHNVFLNAKASHCMVWLPEVHKCRAFIGSTHDSEASISAEPAAGEISWPRSHAVMAVPPAIFPRLSLDPRSREEAGDVAKL